MSDRLYQRLTRYAAWAAVHLVLVVAALAVASRWTGTVALVGALPLLLAWGPFQADVALNPSLDEAARTRWRMVLWCVPWAMVLYWHRHVRPRRIGLD